MGTKLPAMRPYYDEAFSNEALNKTHTTATILPTIKLYQHEAYRSDTIRRRSFPQWSPSTMKLYRRGVLHEWRIIPVTYRLGFSPSHRLAKVADDTLARSKAWPIAPVAVHKRKTKSKSLRGTEDFEKKKICPYICNEKIADGWRSKSRVFWSSSIVLWRNLIH